ncbi:flocculation-associated PEP-CTERM protein PepA [Aestuariibacter sp. A3R04]|uniref:flocculation-associated PEP-CTERM protein PepA n=1 Tax=Aestuariibacter sp. A3R04 TaxID=2841571 RepID=UPI001C08603B|nr:flocculation-associated PEP-CTERM protein PepA [Aestuariibacter sp. A3R04]MBU3021765.1 flocculation-associated PEP-CTERM protein PepA [Aestuariibacter sp. A3R04]
MKFNKVVKSLALTAGLVASFTSSAEFLDFTVDESAYGNGEITGDKFNGSYFETLEFDGMGGFATGAFATFTSIVADEGTNPQGASVLGFNNVNFPGTGYNLYAVLTASGTANALETEFTATTAQFSLWIDPSFDTVSDNLLNGTVTDASADDILIGSASTVQNAYGEYENGTGNFNFDFTDFVLTADGMNYFVDPAPFYSIVTVNGDFDTLGNLPDVSGDLSAVFTNPVNVPEPSTVAVLALGLCGLGFTARRKNK